MVEEARLAAQSKAGEAAVLRQKYEKSAREYEEQLVSLRQVHQEAISKQKAELDAVKRDRERIAANNKFLEHESREASRAKQVHRTLKDAAGSNSKESASEGQTETPKKNKILPFRDGFDDGDLILSPSKSRDKSRPGTPRAGAKRKRPGTTPQDSPVQMEQLALSDPRPRPSPLSISRAAEGGSVANAVNPFAGIKLPPRPTVFQMILTHKVPDSDERVVEILTKYAFPSQPSKKLSSIVYDSINNSATQASGTSEALCNCFISLWDQCLKESFYEPINYIIHTIQCILSFEKLAFTRRYISSIVPLSISSIDLVAIPLSRAFLAQNQNQPNKSKSVQPATPEIPQISVLDALTLLHSVGLACVDYPDDLQLFWSHMKYDFVLMMLMRVQPLPQITLTLSLLRLSVLPSTFGAIISSGDGDGGADRQARHESDTIDRLTLLLSEKFSAGARTDALTHHRAVLHLQLHVLSVLTAMLTSPRTALALATHRHCVGRLVRFLEGAVAALYSAHHGGTHGLRTRAVDAAVRVLYTLVGTPPTADDVDVRAKLAAVPLGAHRWLVALTRLAFADPVLFEEGIAVESMDAAHSLLDEYLSPVEGEGLLMMFSSGRSEGA